MVASINFAVSVQALCANQLKNTYLFWPRIRPDKTLLTLSLHECYKTKILRRYEHQVAEETVSIFHCQQHNILRKTLSKH